MKSKIQTSAKNMPRETETPHARPVGLPGRGPEDRTSARVIRPEISRLEAENKTEIAVKTGNV